MESFNQVRLFFDAVKSISIWKRLFAWASVRSLSFTAWEEYVQVVQSLRRVNEERSNLSTKMLLVEEQKSSLESKWDDLRISYARLEENVKERVHALELKLADVTQQLSTKEIELIEVQRIEEARKHENNLRIGQILTLQEALQKDKEAVLQAEKEKQEANLEKMKRTWAEHESLVQRSIKRICEQRGIDYVTEFPFRGKPDNAVKVSDEIVIFDAKSPANSDLTNFRGYVKSQAEAAKKYAEQSSVRRDIYLVVPTNAVDVLDQLSFDMGNYRVYVITLDALEPVILTLKQIEEYEFVEQLSPEERQSICRIIGSLIYVSKRRVQVDQFFNGHLLDLVQRVQRELPEDLQEEIGKNEKAFKLNPPIDKRTKEISQSSLEKVHQQIDSQARSLDAPTPSSIELSSQ